MVTRQADPQASSPADQPRPEAPARPGLRRFLPTEPAERRTRRDVVIGAALVLVVLVGAAVLAANGEVAGTTLVPAATPVPTPPPATTVPSAFEQAWELPSATPAPVVAGGTVVTADGSTVAGHVARTGAQAWSYTRDTPLCTVGAGFGGNGAGSARVLALYAGPTGWCSELTTLHADTGTRAGARNPDLRPGTRLLDNGSLVAGTGPTIEVMRSDLVRTAEYGAVATPAQAGLQPRPTCQHATTVLAAERLGVIEQCPGEPTDRLTVLRPDENTDGKPTVVYSQVLPARGATLVALNEERAAVALPGPSRLLVLDKAGATVAQVPIDVTTAQLAATAAGRSGAAATVADQRVSWWTGSSTIELDPALLTPIATVAGALGPAVGYGSATLVPVPGGLAVLSGSTIERTVPVARPDRTAPVRLATDGAVLLEQRGTHLVGLLPAH